VESKPTAISYSRIDTFKTCPKRFYETTIAKTIPYVQSEAQKQGDIVHKMLEARVSRGEPFPKGYEYLEPIASSVLKAPGQTHAELELTFTRNLEQCGSKDWDRAWLRALIDVAKIQGEVAWAGDYKTGTRRFDETQLKMYAAVMFQAFPDVQKVSTSFIWLKENHIDEPTTYWRTEAPAIWQEIFDYSAQIEEAKRQNHWPAQPNRFCKWCPVLAAGRCEEGRRRLR
jgi:CRISPR/Cas system-associated exonuclease Cas4 (RecB family)